MNTLNTTNNHPSQATPATRRLRTTLLAASLLAALAVAAALEAAQTKRPPRSGIAPPRVTDTRSAQTFALLWQFGVPQPPEAYVPPEIVHEFWTLLGTFERYGIRAGFTFPEWIVRQGVTDPWEQHALLYLYSMYLYRTALAEQQHRAVAPSAQPRGAMR